MTLYFLAPYSPELNRIENVAQMKCEWMAFKVRDASTLDTNVEEIIAKFGQKYALDFCQLFTELIVGAYLSEISARGGYPAKMQITLW